MSRLGKKPIPVPEKVKVALFKGPVVSVTGPLGQLTRTLAAEGLTARTENKALCSWTAVTTARDQRSLHGTFRKLLSNMVEGASLTGLHKGTDASAAWGFAPR
jgi:large subunit ribosomal protein L6